MEFKTIKENTESLVAIKKSKFLGFLFKIKSKEDFKEKYEKIKKKYFDAKHHTFAYVLIENACRTEKFSDDGEPQGTAGKPMLEFLKKNQLQNVAFVCVRYFGGILLGAGGLVHAYVDALRECFNKAEIISEYRLEKFSFDFEYEKNATLNAVKNNKLVSSFIIEYGEKIKLIVSVLKENKIEFENFLKDNNILDYVSLGDFYGEK